MPFGFLPPAPYMQTGANAPPMIAMPTAFPSSAAPQQMPHSAAASAQPHSGGRFPAKRQYEQHEDSSSSSSSSHPSKYPRSSDSSSRGGRGRGGRGGTRGGGGRYGNSDSGIQDGKPDLSKYLTPTTVQPAARPVTEMYSCATGEMVTIQPAVQAKKKEKKEAPVYCQKYMNNLCSLRSCDAPASDDDDPSSQPARCAFVHSSSFRRNFLAKAHVTHTKFTQERGRARVERNEGPPVDGKLAGLKPPVAESALLRKVSSAAKRTDD
jgi:hypothetical protein